MPKNKPDRERTIMKILVIISLLLFCAVMPAEASQESAADKIKTSEGDLVISVLGHASLMMSHAGRVVHVDPFSAMADYTKMPEADLILITHEHTDHFDLKAIDNIKAAHTKIIGTGEVAQKLPGIIIMKNGDTKTVGGFKIEAVPAYNIEHMRRPGVPFHPKGVGNGYIITFGDKRVYIAGDTENIPEMKQLKNIDVAFLPMNIPYTMTPEMVADAAKAIRPKILYPYHYHFGTTDIPKLIELLQDAPEIDVRIRREK